MGGRQLDLAYTFTTTDGVTYTNLGRAAGCAASDVSLSFVLPGATGAQLGAYVPPNAGIGGSLAPIPSSADTAPTGTDGTAPRARPSSPGSTRWRRPVGPVRIGLTSLLIAPGKSSGAPWDGLGALPEDTARGLRAGITVEASRALASLFVDVGTANSVGRIVPWASRVLANATQAPDVRATVSIDGTQVSTSRTRMHSYTPSWPGLSPTAYTIGHDQHITVDAYDTDLAFDDHIGLCTMQGMPLVDRNGYARAEDFTCNGQLWAVRLRIVATEYEPVPDSEVQAPPPSAQPPPTMPAAEGSPMMAPGHAPQHVRRGGAGESCTRTDDCEAPLRCVRQECREATSER